ncbi:unnamed protein product [Owenia fusiformis]|uniref:TBC1 domain family member 23 n=1 Tax=Owenia fusiformis TaxID=6347 RepID=A0A8J1XU19_OWEFU|nr:unnamed protein product [Owenia fusiformis]
MEDENDTSWIPELETALLEGCDFGRVKSICNGRLFPDHLRQEIWQICLGVVGKGDSLSEFDGLYDMSEQGQVREDCQSLVDRIGNEEEEKVAIVSDLETILTLYCKSRGAKYGSKNGWLEILQPMLALKLSRSDLYNCFYAILTRFIPRECHKNGKPFHLFRLLLLYHDPELCSFLDTKRITPDLYALSWFQTLFASTCDLEVTHKMWDVYLLHSDPFLMFFLALVLVVNAKEQVMAMEDDSKQQIIETLRAVPAALESEDIEDFCSLAQYYSSKTPQSFRRDYQGPLFGLSIKAQKDDDPAQDQVSQALCLPVSVAELLQSNTNQGSDGVRYFVVDCRPAEQYNSGHLPTAFHLDANLMLQNPTEFGTAVQALCTTQKQAIAAGSVAGGEHLCFMGSGREEEDQYVNMVVANFLQKNSQYVSVARGGYSALHHALREQLSQGLLDHHAKTCIMCNPETALASGGNETDTSEDFHPLEKGDSFFDKMSSVVKTKGATMKEKMVKYIKNEHNIQAERHVSNRDVGKPYRGSASVFSIGDDEDDEVNAASSDEEAREVVNIDTWLNKPDVTHAFDCQEVQENGYLWKSHLLVTKTHMFILREIPNKKGMAWIKARRALGSIVKITSKKRHPELITFKYGTNEDDGLHITSIDRFLIRKAGEATKVIKTQIMKVLDALES